MKQRLFDEIPDDELIAGRFYNDGGHNVWIEKTVNPRARKRTRYKEQEIEIAPGVLSELQEAGEGGRNIFTDNETVDDDYVMEILANEPLQEDCGEVVESLKSVQNNAQKTLKMTPRALFDILYDSYANLKWKQKRNALIVAFIPYYKNYYRAVEFVDKNMERRKHNKNSRYLRAYRKCTLNRFNYFVTFTYDDNKMDAEGFKKKLKDYLSNKVKRDGWKYLGVWEGWDGSVRLHFHALMYIPDSTMPGKLLEESSYNTSQKKMRTTTYNTEFNEKFGRSDVEQVIPQIAGCAYHYVLKYLDKGGKLMTSKNCPGYVTGYVKKGELAGRMLSNEHKYVMFPKTEMVTLHGEVIRVDENKPQECLSNATTCN